LILIGQVFKKIGNENNIKKVVVNFFTMSFIQNINIMNIDIGICK